MIFSIQQLQKFRMPYEFEESIDLSDVLKTIPGVKECSLVNVIGVITRISNSTYKISFKVKCNFILECAISLADVPHIIDTEFFEFFSLENYPDSFEIIGQSLDTKEAVLTELFTKIPMKVVANDVSFESNLEADDSKYINPAFESLKKYL